MPGATMGMRRTATLLVGGLFLIAAIGCGDGPCGKSEDRSVPLSEFPCAMMSGGGVWASHPFPTIEDEQCYWFEFRGCSRYAFENPLGEAPINVTGHLSFEPDGSFSTTGSGNSFVVDQVSDSEVVVRNAQNQLFYLRLVLE